MNNEQIKRLNEIEKHIKQIAEDIGLTTTEIDFEIVSSRKMIESMAYRFTTNFSHWSFGRDYDKQKTLYEHHGAGIPYETVWNSVPPKAFLVETNPVILNILVMAHVYGHVDFNLENKYMRSAAEYMDLAREARNAEKRFRNYEKKYGLDEYEQTIDSAFSVCWHLPPDLLAEQESEEMLRERLIDLKRERIRSIQKREFHQDKNEIDVLTKEIQELKRKTPVVPRYDILRYIINNSPKPLEDWQTDILSTIREQTKFFEFQKRCKLLNEGWATYVHLQIMRKLYEEKLISAEEHKEFSSFHSKVTREATKTLNWYNVGLKLYEDLIYRWDRGMHGKEFRESKDPEKWISFHKMNSKGIEKIFEVRKNYTDRMAIEEFFDEDFIKDAQIYLWSEQYDPQTGEIIQVISEDNPDKIKRVLKSYFSLYATPIITIEDGNYNDNRELYLKHDFTGQELNPKMESGALENLYYLWGKPVHLETVEIETDKTEDSVHTKKLLHTYDGARHHIEVISE
ncbi:MAG: SpoVR family protein [Balneolaceae bacterium]